MNSDSMAALKQLRFFVTPGHPCSYLDHQEATTLFADPHADIDTAVYSALSASGFRRSGAHIYRPHCQTCQACVPVRVRVAESKLNRRQRRVRQRNQDLSICVEPPQMTDEYFDLFSRYIAQRHGDGDMFPADPEQFRSFLVDGRREARFVEFRLNQRLLAVAVIDVLDNALSAVYTFFDPKDDQRSLGTFAVLWLIEEACRQEKSWLYLGYWIKECQKMSYKIDYQPIELYLDNGWITSPP